MDTNGGGERVVEEHVSPDGLLKLRIVTDDDGDVTLGFIGFQWHMHADILAATTELPEAEAVRRFVGELVDGRSVIVLWSVDGELRDVWVSNDPAADSRYASTASAELGESVALRHWDGRAWYAETLPTCLDLRRQNFSKN
jgi:hypothetical protein